MWQYKRSTLYNIKPSKETNICSLNGLGLTGISRNHIFGSLGFCVCVYYREQAIRLIYSTIGLCFGLSDFSGIKIEARDLGLFLARMTTWPRSFTCVTCTTNYIDFTDTTQFKTHSYYISDRSELVWSCWLYIGVVFCIEFSIQNHRPLDVPWYRTRIWTT